MTTPTGIDRDAPVIAHHQIDIAATPGQSPGHHSLAGVSLAIN